MSKITRIPVVIPASTFDDALLLVAAIGAGAALLLIGAGIVKAAVALPRLVISATRTRSHRSV